MSGTTLLAPCAGTLHPITACSDDVFAGELLGPGVLLRPDPGRTTVVSPISGRLLTVHPHAFVVVGDAGDAGEGGEGGGALGVLVHLGINTVRLHGAGYELHAAAGDTVAAGDPVVTWDPSAITDPGMTDEVPVVLMERPAGSLPAPEEDRRVATGDLLLHLPG